MGHVAFGPIQLASMDHVALEGLHDECLAHGTFEGFATKPLQHALLSKSAFAAPSPPPPSHSWAKLAK